MAYINKGDLLEVNGLRYIAASQDYVKAYGGLSGGRPQDEDWEVAPVVDLLSPETGSRSTIRLKFVRKLSEA